MVTGASQGSGAAVAGARAAGGCGGLCPYLRVDDPAAPGFPPAYRDARLRDGSTVADRIRAAGGRALAIEASLADPATAAGLFDTAEEHLGPVDILVNNASGWVADTFRPAHTDAFGRAVQRVNPGTWLQQFSVDAMAAGLLTAEVARPHIARGGTAARGPRPTPAGAIGCPPDGAPPA